MSVAEPAADHTAVALLPLPDWVDLSDHQVRGAACVWCAAPLASGAVVDLGARRIKASDGTISVFPRACRRCVAEHALHALHDHAPLCERCVDDASNCDTGKALWRVIREARR